MEKFNLGQRSPDLSSEKITVSQRSISEVHANRRAQNEFESGGRFEKIEQEKTKKKGGRPPKEAEECLSAPLKIYVSSDMKRYLIKHYGSTTKMRQLLLTDSGYTGPVE